MLQRRPETKFRAGDRVRVTADWTECKDRIGTVSEFPDGLRPTGPGPTYWVELDVAEWKPGVCEAGEFEEESLTAAVTA